METRDFKDNNFVTIVDELPSFLQRIKEQNEEFSFSLTQDEKAFTTNYVIQKVCLERYKQDKCFSALMFDDVLNLKTEELLKVAQTSFDDLYKDYYDEILKNTRADLYKVATISMIITLKRIYESEFLNILQDCGEESCSFFDFLMAKPLVYKTVSTVINERDTDLDGTIAIYFATKARLDYDTHETGFGYDYNIAGLESTKLLITQILGIKTKKQFEEFQEEFKDSDLFVDGVKGYCELFEKELEKSAEIFSQQRFEQMVLEKFVKKNFKENETEDFSLK